MNIIGILGGTIVIAPWASISGLTKEVLTLAKVAAGVWIATVVIKANRSRVEVEDVKEAICMVVAIRLTPRSFTEPEWRTI